MRKRFSACILLLFTFFLGCSCNDTKEINNVTHERSAVSDTKDDADAFSNIIVRDSVVVLKYKSQTDTIRFPVINPRFPTLAKSLHPETILGERLFSIKDNYENCGCGYVSLSYQKSFSNSKIISLWYHSAFQGPYPSETIIYQTLNISNGKPYHLTEQLNSAGQKYLLAKYKSALLARLEKGKAVHKEKQYDEAYQQISNSINELTFDGINDNYIVGDGFINVKTEPVLPHVSLVFEIDRLVDFSFEELKTFKKNGASI